MKDDRMVNRSYDFRLSPTQINMYRKCSAQWEFRYIDGIKTPPSIHLATGSGADKGLELNFNHKKTEGVDAKIDSILDAAGTEFEKKFVDIEEKEKSELDKGKEKDDMYAGLIEYRKKHARYIKAEDIEETQPMMNLEVMPTVLIIGYADLLTKDKIIDFKMVGKKPQEIPREDYIIQQGLYQQYWQKPNPPELHYMVKPSPRLPARVFKHPVIVDPKLLAAMVKPVIKGIDNEIFAPNRGHMLCSRKWCGYWDLCEKKYGGTVKG